MTGDAPDILSRLKAVLPSRWFADETPVLDGLLYGLAWGWAWIYSMITYTTAQTRVTTATDLWLDIIARDFFGNRIRRLVNEQDDRFRQRIKAALLREHGTRNAIVSALIALTGREPQIFEPARTTDTGGYGNLANPTSGLAWGLVGGWGNLNLPFQCFITAYRPGSNGIASVSGWSQSPTAAIGGYGSGAIEYATLEMLQGQVLDEDIYRTIADVMPIAAIGWTQISN